MNEITINVVGKAGTGKSTIVRLLSKLLSAGFEDVNVNLLEDDIPESYHAKLNHLQNSDLKITINEVQDKRSSGV